MDDPLNLMRVIPPKGGPKADGQFSQPWDSNAWFNFCPQMNTDFHRLPKLPVCFICVSSV